MQWLEFKRQTVVYVRVAMPDKTANGLIAVEVNVFVGWRIDASREVHIDDCANHYMPRPQQSSQS